MYDLIIIGSGPAGYTAGIYAVRREMKTLIIGKEPGGQIMWASEIENYPGINKIGNYELIEKMQSHAKEQGVEILTAEVKRIEKKDDHFILNTQDKTFEAKTVIIAMGLKPRRLAIPGEEVFNGRGVSYCANCDGPFYKNKTIAVVGGGNSALDAAEVLSKIASKVYLIHRRQDFKAFEALVEEVKLRPNIELVLDSKIKEIRGGDIVENIVLQNVSTDQETEIKLDGVFIEVGRIAHTDLVGDLVNRDERNQILVDAKCRTKTPGLFAAGDVTQVDYKQITIACGQGTIAALAAYQYLQEKGGAGSAIPLDRSIKK
jgi:thioredoxin-disulfide reductase